MGKQRTKEQIKADIKSESKVCQVCKKRKDFKEFYNRAGSIDTKGPRCKVCDGLARQKNRQNNLAKSNASARKRNLLFKYGITEQVMRDMMDKQRGCCKICKGTLVKPDSNMRMVVDHNHTTGKVRGLLCHHCNAMLGQAKDSPTILMRGLSYLLSEGYYGKEIH